MIQKLDTPALAATLFGGWPEGMIWACLQGRMGAVFADDSLSSAAAVLGDFAFFAGVPDTALLDAVSVPLLVPQNDAWADAIAAHFGPGVQPMTRYATRKNTVFDRECLKKYACDLPKSYTIRIINKELYDLCWKNSWSRDLYPSWDAHDTVSLALAQQLGYQPDKPYLTFLRCSPKGALL